MYSPIVHYYWDRHPTTGGFGEAEKIYVVQTTTEVIQRCILMATDPGDLCSTRPAVPAPPPTVAEQWGRRWITIDTSASRSLWPVPASWARAIRSTCWPIHAKARLKEAEVTRSVAPSSQPTHGNIRHGFVYERVPHVTLKSIANNAEIDVIWDKWQAKLEPLRESA